MLREGSCLLGQFVERRQLPVGSTYREKAVACWVNFMRESKLSVRFTCREKAVAWGSTAVLGPNLKDDPYMKARGWRSDADVLFH